MKKRERNKALKLKSKINSPIPSDVISTESTNVSPSICVLIIIVLTILLRLVVNSLFFKKFGANAAYVIEIWFYYGVAKGSFLLSRLDPTFWLLQICNSVKALSAYHAIVGMGCLLTMLTSVLIFIYVRMIYSDKPMANLAGLLTSLFYMSVITVLGMNLANFFHDNVALVVFMLLLIVTECILRANLTRARFTWWLIWGVLVLVGTLIGPLIAIGVFVSLAVIFLRTMSNRLSRRMPEHKFFLKMIMIFALSIIVLRFVLLDHILRQIFELASVTRGIDVFNQLRFGIKDLLPIAFGDFCKQYNVFLFFVPMGLIVAYRKRDLNTLILVLIGLVLVTAVSRADRILVIGMCMLATHALLDFNKKWLGFNLLIFCIILFIFVFETQFKMKYGLLIGGTALATFFLSSPEVKLPYVFNTKTIRVLMLFIAPALLNTYLLLITMKPRTMEAEYKSYQWLYEHGDNSKQLLVTWPDGYFAEAISGLESAMSPVKIKDKLKKIYWFDEREAHRKLEENNVGYLVVSNKYLRVGQGNFTILPSLKSDDPKFVSNVQNTVLYKMLYQPEKLSRFKLIHYQKDSFIGDIVYVYKVM